MSVNRPRQARKRKRARRREKHRANVQAVRDWLVRPLAGIDIRRVLSGRLPTVQVGLPQFGPIQLPEPVKSFAEFVAQFGDDHPIREVANAVRARYGLAPLPPPTPPPPPAFEVTCDETNNTPEDREARRVNVRVALHAPTPLDPTPHIPIPCTQCGKHVERERRVYVVPTCFECLPPPPPLPISPLPMSRKPQ